MVDRVKRNAPFRNTVVPARSLNYLGNRPTISGAGKKTNGAPRKLEVHQVPVADVTIRGGRRACDAVKVRELAESISVIGLRTPITVRSVRKVVDGIKTVVVVLVSGRHRLEAAKSLGRQFIDCTFFEGDDTDARLWEIAENLHRAELVVLDRSEAIAEWVRLTEQRRSISGQAVRKVAVGRPEGGIALVARELNIQAESNEGRRKLIERAIKIDNISPEAKAAVRDAGFADNQSTLLVIAKEKTPEAQIKRAREILERSRRPRRASTKAASNATALAKQGNAKQIAGPLLDAVPTLDLAVDGTRPTVPQAISESTLRTTFDPGGSADSACQDTFSALEGAWQGATELRRAWDNAPREVRERFVTEILRWEGEACGP